MATVDRPTLLASASVSGSGSANLSPAADTSWEVHSIVVAGAADVDLNFDPNEDTTFDGAIPIASFSGAGYSHADKIEVEDGTMRVEFTDTSGSANTIYLVGVAIT